MISTGNDIVALKAINVARTKQQKFYNKIITGSEKALYEGQFSERLPFEYFVWLAWSVKESVFKYLQRLNPELIFSPSKIKISKLEPPSSQRVSHFEGRDFNKKTVYEGIIDYSPHTFYSRTIITDDFIFSVVSHTNNFEKVMWGIKKIGSTDADDQSKAVRTFALAMLNTLFPDSELQIDKNNHSCPVILKNDIEILVPISLAHHDHWVGYSFQV
ncbi:4'-phosphopantetheinyl transferase superfamily protein [Mucilaginibacter sp. BT774]|uniref:4'-phosphopantetheinyl transferase family protein n=1 Tax=Mucilaginibacter sp. BT774 TaxID=3062276 RepID=UPI002674F788|nr:4'-phosphopantetheinyl transferase superfamily protein [Mucilaginibacter sp. BT774]MDO3625743.1 4'-phosphopantetheinyl transferase superfamily protein [Mucilaginibacter sp. BT774]